MKLDDLEATLTERLEQVLSEDMKDYVRNVLKNGKTLLVHNSPVETEMFIKLRATDSSNHNTNKAHVTNELADIFDKFFMEEFGHPYITQSIYTTQTGLAIYGKAYAVIPFGGKATYCFSKDVKDILFNYMEFLKDIDGELYSTFKEQYSYEIEAMVLDRDVSIASKLEQLRVRGMEKVFEKGLEEFFKNTMSNYRQTDDFLEVVNSMPRDHEIMVDAPKFLLISKSYVSRKFGLSVEEYLTRFI